MNALRRIHAALVPGGLVVDTQPVSPHPPVQAGGERLGTLDMRQWLETIGAEFLDIVPEWRGTKVSDELRRRAGLVEGPLAVHQDIRLRLLRALEPA